MLAISLLTGCTSSNHEGKEATVVTDTTVHPPCTFTQSVQIGYLTDNRFVVVGGDERLSTIKWNETWDTYYEGWGSPEREEIRSWVIQMITKTKANLIKQGLTGIDLQEQIPVSSNFTICPELQTARLILVSSKDVEFSIYSGKVVYSNNGITVSFSTEILEMILKGQTIEYTLPQAISVNPEEYAALAVKAIGTYNITPEHQPMANKLLGLSTIGQTTQLVVTTVGINQDQPRLWGALVPVEP